MKIFLTGATGYVGSAVAAELVRGRHEVTALVRSSASAARVRSYGIDPLEGNLREPSSYRDAALAADVIVHAGVEGGPDRMDVDRTFIDAVAGPSLIYTSVLFVLGDVDGGDVDEGDEDSPASGQRATHESLVLDAGGAVIRPGMIWGDDAWLFQHPLYIEPGTNRWPLVHRDDLAVLYREVVEQQARGIFHGVTEVRAAAEVFPGHGRTLEDARAELGGFADALALDQNVGAPRSRALGWMPLRRYA
jgi:nucleoside-diphosphate-sugar epimerase